VQQIEEVGNV